MAPNPLSTERPPPWMGQPGRFQAAAPACPEEEALRNSDLTARAEVFRLLASAERLELLGLLPPGAAPPAGHAGRRPAHGVDLEWLGHALRVPGAVVQEHLDLLRAGFITARRGAAGKVHYVRNDDHLSTLSTWLGGQAE